MGHMGQIFRSCGHNEASANHFGNYIKKTQSVFIFHDCKGQVGTAIVH